MVDSLVVRVADVYGNGIGGRAVTWTPLPAGGGASPSLDSTGAQGTVKSRWTLGTAVGVQSLIAMTDAFAPVRFTAFATAWASVSAGGAANCGVTTREAAYCWGDNTYGELGVGTATGPQTCVGLRSCSTTPVSVSGGVRVHRGERRREVRLWVDALLARRTAGATTPSANS